MKQTYKGKDHKQEWFTEWFNSHFYPVVYHHRDEEEALQAVQLFLHSVPLPKGSKILDLCCGTGRHAIPLAQQGYNVTGLDISATLLGYAQQAAAALPNLRFVQQDMRQPFPDTPYDAIVNLFTSFGYFSTPQEDWQVLQNVGAALRSSGFFFFDYLNAAYVCAHLVPKDMRQIQRWQIIQHRQIVHHRLHKRITIVDLQEHKSYHFEEYVRLYTLEDFERLFQRAGLTIRKIFGNYDGSAYQQEYSPRLIIVAQKTMEHISANNVPSPPL